MRDNQGMSRADSEKRLDERQDYATRHLGEPTREWIRESASGSVLWTSVRSEVEDWMEEHEQADHASRLEVVEDGVGFRPLIKDSDSYARTITFVCKLTTVDVFETWERAFTVGMAEIKEQGYAVRLDEETAAALANLIS